MKRAEFSHHAKSDLREIVEFIALDKPSAARDLGNRLRETCQLLATQPEIGRLRIEFDIFQLRSFPVGKFIIFYQPNEAGIFVIRLIHAARDIRVL